MEVFVDDETKLTLHGLQQYYSKLKDSEKNRKLFDLLDALEFNQVHLFTWHKITELWYKGFSTWKNRIPLSFVNCKFGLFREREQTLG